MAYAMMAGHNVHERTVMILRFREALPQRFFTKIHERAAQSRAADPPHVQEADLGT
jgi:hypothetical protein